MTDIETLVRDLKCDDGHALNRERAKKAAALIEKQAKEISKLKKAPKYKLGKLPNRRGGFYHVHSGQLECGQAYWSFRNESWLPCKRLVNHKGPCDYENNSAF